ncbi:uncharacterized protein LOC144124418 [Amblyomma americanum]
MAAEELKEQEVEVLMEWETDSSGTISAEEEMPIPVSPPMRKKPCHRQLPFDRNQSDREAAVAGLRQGTGNAQATARPSLQARRVAVMRYVHSAAATTIQLHGSLLQHSSAL